MQEIEYLHDDVITSFLERTDLMITELFLMSGRRKDVEPVRYRRTWLGFPYLAQINCVPLLAAHSFLCQLILEICVYLRVVDTGRSPKTAEFKQWMANAFTKNSTVFVLVLSVLMLCALSNRRRPFSFHTKTAEFEHFRVLSVFSGTNRHKLRRVH